jgi:hypothetical protein
MAPEDGPTAPLWEGTINADPYALLLSETNATVSGLTFSGQGAEVILDGGTPSLTDSVFMGVGRAFDGSNLSPNASSVVVTGGASPLVARNMIRDGGPIGVFGGSNPTIKANTLTGGPHIFLYVHGDGVVIEDNTIDGTLRWAIGSFRRGGRADITRNTITNPGANGINLTDGTADIVGNAISGATAAGITTGLELVNVVDNQLADNKIGVLFSAGEGEVSGNTVRGGDIGFALSTNVRVSGNDVEGASGPGISITFGAPMLRENRSCGNGTDLLIADRAQPDVDESNEICEAEPAA